VLLGFANEGKFGGPNGSRAGHYQSKEKVVVGTSEKDEASLA